MIEALNAEYAKLEAEFGDADEIPEEIDGRLGEIKVALAAFEERSVTFDPAEIARAGVYRPLRGFRRHPRIRFQAWHIRP